MPRRRDERNRVLGPTWCPSIGYWRVVVVTPAAPDPKDRRTPSFYREKDEADEVAEQLRLKLLQLEAITLQHAVTQYEQHLVDKNTIGYVETIRRLRAFFPDLQLLVGRVTPERAREYYEVFRRRLRPDGKPISVSYHRAALINARSLFTWCVEKGWITLNPFAAVKGIGKRKRGKDKHTVDELKKIFLFCLDRAADHDAELAVLSAFLLALRSSDLTRRVVRDVDAGATQLNIHDGKSDKTNEPREIPVALQPFYRARVQGRKPFEPLFPTPYTKSGHHTRRWLEEAMVRICEAVGVPYRCPHSLKSAAGTVLAKRGALANQIVDHLSHTEGSTTFGHYVDRALVDQAQAERVFQVIAGGKR
jgi:integrase